MLELVSTVGSSVLAWGFFFGLELQGCVMNWEYTLICMGRIYDFDFAYPRGRKELRIFIPSRSHLENLWML